MFDPRAMGHRHRQFLTLIVGLTLCAGPSLLAFGCGAEAAEDPTADQTSLVGTSVPSPETSAHTTSSAAPDSTTTAAPPHLTARTPQAAFVYLSERLTSIPVYSPAYLPTEAALAATWWPVTEIQRPSDYTGPAIDNPRVYEANGVAVAAQVVLAVGKGSLAILENYRGDLGDVVGETVGEVGGNKATRYSVGDGTAVQWSDEGLWFVVFGRNISASEVTKVALSMGKSSSDLTTSQ
jgi:hypothetical protein